MSILGVHKSLPLLGEVPVIEGAMVGGTASSITLGQLAQTINDVLAQHLKVHAVWWSDASDVTGPPDPGVLRIRLHTSPALGKDDGGALPQTNLAVRFVLAPSRFDATSKPDPSVTVNLTYADGSLASVGTPIHHNYRSPDLGPANFRWIEQRLLISGVLAIADQTFELTVATTDLCELVSVTVYEQTLLALDSSLELAADNSQMLVGSRIYDSGLQSIYTALRKIYERQGAVLFTNAAFDASRSYALAAAFNAATSTNVLNAQDNTSKSTYTTGSYSFVAGRIYFARIYNTRAASVAVPTVIADGLGGHASGMTWATVQNITEGGSANWRVLRTIATINSTGTLGIDFAGSVQTGCGWIVDEYIGLDQSGTSGSGAVVQSATGSGTAVTTLSATLAAFASVLNISDGCFFKDSTGAYTPGSGFAGIATQTFNAVVALISENKVNGGSPSVSWTGAVNARAIGMELKVDLVALRRPFNVIDPTLSAYDVNGPGFWCDPQYHGSLNDTSVGVVIWAKRKPAAGAGSVPTASPLRISFVYSGGTIGFIDIPDDMPSEGTSTFNAVGTYALQTRWVGASLLSGGVKVDVLAQYNDGNSNAGPDRLDSFGMYEKEPLDPRSIPNLAVWLAADKLGLTDGTAVGTWADASGNGNNATQGTAGNKPIFKTGIISGMPVVRFDGVDDFMAIADSATYKGGALTVFAVVRETQALGAVSRKLIVGYPDNGTFATPFYRWAVTTSNPAGTQKHDIYLNGVATTSTGGILGSMGGQLGVARVLTFAPDYDGLAKLVRNGPIFIDISQTAATITYPNAVGLRIGGCDGTHDNYGFDIAELLVFARKLTTEEKLQVGIFLAEKYGLGMGNQ